MHNNNIGHHTKRRWQHTALQPTNALKANRLIVITGPTGSGKSSLAIEVAQHFGCEIISADSRQIYKGIPIGTAAPTAQQLAAVPHHFVNTLELDQYYSAAQFEQDVIGLLPRLFEKSSTQVMCGGSMMYVDAVTRGIDQLPTISAEVRQHAYSLYEQGGLELLRTKLKALDPEYYEVVDINNHKRLIHAIEICIEAGTTYSSLRTGQIKPRDFDIVIFAIDYPRQQLYDRINQRVDAMIEQGLEQEAQSVYHLRHLNSLNTVGYKEMFAIFDGTMDRATAIARLAKNTRVYAKKQLTWLNNRPEIHRLNPNNPLLDQLLQTLNQPFL